MLVLRSLEEKPMHGYEVMKSIEDRFHGFYKPSAGAVYPALKSLLQEGYVNVEESGKRKTYRITEKGCAFLSGCEAEFERKLSSFESSVGKERAALMREIRMTGRLLGASMKHITPKQAERLGKVIADSRRRMMEILSK